ncbi:unnamed protein product [Aphanomyces euteiches]
MSAEKWEVCVAAGLTEWEVQFWPPCVQPNGANSSPLSLVQSQAVLLYVHSHGQTQRTSAVMRRLGLIAIDL